MSRELDAMRRLEQEDKIPIKAACALIEGCPTERSVRRFFKEGRYVRETGATVFLEAYRGFGRRLITSKQAVRRFLERLNGGE